MYSILRERLINLKGQIIGDVNNKLIMKQQKRIGRASIPLKISVKDSGLKALSESTDDENSVGSFEFECSDNEYEFPHYSQCAKSAKYKTEMCKNYSQMGYCPYYEKCQFAHGYHDLIVTPILLDKLVRQSSKARRCKNFWNTGQCAYGLRCQFSHYQVNQETLNYLKIQASVLENPEQQPIVNTGSRLLKGLYSDYSSLYSIMDE